MAEGYEAYHVPQQSRRDKLRVVATQNEQQQQEEGLAEYSTFLPLSDSSSLISSSDLLTTFHNNNNNNNNKHNFGSSMKEERSNLMMRFAASSSCTSNSSSVSYLDPHSSLPLNQASIQVLHNNSNNNMFLYQAQNIRDFDHSYHNNHNSNGGDPMMVFKPEPLSLSLSSSHNSNNNSSGLNLERYGSVIYGGCVNYGGSASNEVTRGAVPMGPFTGYASVLKGSRFLKPAQQLLEELCDVGVCGEKIVADASLMEPIAMSPPSSQISSEDPLAHHAVHGPKKSRLLTMLDEVYRRYRQYYQQMHAVVTSFEYVSGLSNAAPFASLAIKAMSKHFRCLKNAITDQLQFANKVHFHVTTRKEESPRFGNSDSGTYSQRPGFLEQQPVWRPQRGLPERAVTVLRAWLFEHFLHPYPTDTDKLMLAKQTGLSRSQVSNWFINARVRLWKPMVEEIHMLETRQAQKNLQKEEEYRNKSTDHLLSDNNVSENPSPSTDTLQDAPYKRAMSELPNIPVRNPELLNLPCTGNQPGGVGVSIGGSGSNNVSLTLGLYQNHGIGLAESFPLSATQRFGVTLDANNEGYVLSGFDSQNRHFGRDVIGGQLLHDFVG